jgi:hypothetical protein
VSSYVTHETNSATYERPLYETHNCNDKSGVVTFEKTLDLSFLATTCTYVLIFMVLLIVKMSSSCYLILILYSCVSKPAGLFRAQKTLFIYVNSCILMLYMCIVSHNYNIVVHVHV